MKEALLQLFGQHADLAIAISLGVSILIALLGIIPSFFVTAANILFFGFWPGTAISFLGESIGALLAFLLYRKGFRTSIRNGLERFPRAMELADAKGSKAFLLILSLRLLPFVPSGLVTFAASAGTVSAGLFFAASSIGKIPALLIEAFSVAAISVASWPLRIALGVVAVGVLFFVLRRPKN